MEPFELELKNALNRRTPMAAADAASLNDQIVRAYARKQRAAQNLTRAYLVGMTLTLILFFWLFLNTPDLKLSLLYGIAILIVFEGTVLMKLWFWVMHSKIATIREIKQLELCVAEALSRQAAPAPTAAPATVASPEPLPPAAPVPHARRWRLIGGGLWLASLICLAYLIWGGRSDEPHNAAIYFTRAVSAAEAASTPEWQDTFEVRDPRKRFYLHLTPEAGPTHLVVTVAPEGGELLFRGPVENASRIYFGLNPPPGRYTVKVQAREHSSAYTLRILGVDDLPANLPGRSLLIMICAAFVFSIPVIWLQGRFLKQIDPGLAR